MLMMVMQMVYFCSVRYVIMYGTIFDLIVPICRYPDGLGLVAVVSFCERLSGCMVTLNFNCRRR